MSGNKAFVTEAGGDLLQVNVGDPGAGNDWLFTNQFADGINYRLRIMAIRFIYTSAAGVDRQPLIRLQAGGIVLFSLFCGTKQPSVAAWEWTLAPGLVDAQLDNNAMVPWPDVFIEPAYTIGSVTAAIQPADTYTDLSIYFQRWRT